MAEYLSKQTVQNQLQYSLYTAYIIADMVLKKLEPHCTLIDLAGSIRRRKPFVKDIEICCLPKKVTLWNEQIDLFLQSQSRKQPIEEFGNGIYDLAGEIVKGNLDGRYMQIVLPEGIKLDLFIPEGNDYYRQLAIRTGSADYSFKTIATAWRKKGWCGTSNGLRKIMDCEFVNEKYVCVNSNAELPPCWNSEKEFFDWLEITYLSPEKRI